MPGDRWLLVALCVCWCATHALGGTLGKNGAGQDACVTFWRPNASALAFPGDLGIQWSTQYDTQWFLSVLHDVHNTSRAFGVELSVARITSSAGNCAHDTGLTFVFCGMSDASQGTYTQTSIEVPMNTSSGDVHSQPQPFDMRVNLSAPLPSLEASVVAAASSGADELLYTVSMSGPAWRGAAAKLAATTPLALANVPMAANGWIDMLVSNFAQVSQPALDVQGEITLPSGESVTVAGTMWLQHIWGTDPLSVATRRAPPMGIPPPVLAPAASLGAQPHWTWQCVRLQHVALSLTRFVADTTPPPQYLNVVTLATGKSVEFTGDNFTVTLFDDWKSPASGFVYARKSNLVIPSLAVNLTWTTYVADNEHYLPGVVTYYEAASTVTGTWGDRTVSGLGYLEHRVA